VSDRAFVRPGSSVLVKTAAVWAGHSAVPCFAVPNWLWPAGVTRSGSWRMPSFGWTQRSQPVLWHLLSPGTELPVPEAAAPLDRAGALAPPAPTPDPRQRLKPSPLPGCAARWHC